MLDMLWDENWKEGLVILRKTRRDDPLCDQLEGVCMALSKLESLEKNLYDLFKLSGPLDPTALRQHCEASIQSETSSNARTQKKEWLQSLDKLHHLRKEKVDILTDLTEQYVSRPGVSTEKSSRPRKDKVCHHS
jgi:hypothetical protein